MKIQKTKSSDRAGLFALSISSGILLGAAFPPIPTGVTAFVGFIPFLFLMERVKNIAQAFRYGYITFLFFNFTAVYWISGWSGNDIWLMISGVAVNIVHPLLFCVPAVIYYAVRQRYGLQTGIISFPFLWIAYEWSAHLPELSFPWLVLANTQTYNIHSIQFIDITGAFGASFWIVTINAILFYLVYQFIHKHWTMKSWQLKTTVGAILLLLIVPILYSHFVMRTKDAKKKITVGICQPDVDPYDKWSLKERPGDKIDNLLRQYDSLSRVDGMKLVLMPETAIPFRIAMASYEQEFAHLIKRIDSVKIPLLTGFPDLNFYDEGKAPASAKKFPDSPIRYDDFNSALLVLPNTTSKQIYHKVNLTPMSERIPYLDLFPSLQEALTWGVGISCWGIGKDTIVFTLPIKKDGIDSTFFWSMICYETLYPRFVSEFVRRGSQFLVVITNDGWFGNTSGPYQLQRYTVLRAIENHRGVARCANNGISCFIDPYGHVSQETDLYTRTTIHGDVELSTSNTFYTTYGDWLPIGCTFISGLFILGLFFIKKAK